MKGTLFLVATPIGNLEDITYRAVRILKEVDLILAEDTRQTLKLLNQLEISKPLETYHRHNEEEKQGEIIQKLLEGKSIALVTDAGTPGISDPGEVLVKEAIKNDISIVPIPGACALINALVCSGLSTEKFSFYGFLPQNKNNRREVLSQIRNDKKTCILYEAPHKLIETLKELEKRVEDRSCVVAKELTKIHETFYRGKISDILEKIKEPKGEYIILVEGNNLIEENALNEMSLEEHYNYYKGLGFDKKEIIKSIAKDRNVKKDEIYKYFIEKGK